MRLLDSFILCAWLLQIGCSGDGPVEVVPTPWPVHVTLHESPTWYGDRIVYVDQGIVCARENGIVTIDPNLQGLWVLDLVEHKKERIFPYGEHPDWAPSGKEIAFDYSGRIFALFVDSTQARQVSGGPRDFFPAWDPSGRRIAYRSQDPEHGFFISTFDLKTMTVIPIGLRAPGASDMPDWSPTGDCILHVRYVPEDRTTEVFCSDSTGAQVNRMTWNSLYKYFPQYSPDGRLIAFSADNPWPPRIWIMNADGTGLNPLTSTESGREYAWSPDGKAIVYTRAGDWRYPGNGLLWTVDLQTRTETQLTSRWEEQCL